MGRSSGGVPHPQDLTFCGHGLFIVVWLWLLPGSVLRGVASLRRCVFWYGFLLDLRPHLNLLECSYPLERARVVGQACFTSCCQDCLWLSSVSIAPKDIRGKTTTKHHNPGGGDPWPDECRDPRARTYDHPSAETREKSETPPLNTVDPLLRSSCGQHHCLVSCPLGNVEGGWALNKVDLYGVGKGLGKEMGFGKEPGLDRGVRAWVRVSLKGRGRERA